MLRVGIIGVGRTAGGHARAARAHPDSTVTAVAEIDEGKGRAFAQAQGGIAWHADYRDLCASDDVDAVVVTAPNFLHAPAVLAAIALQVKRSITLARAAAPMRRARSSSPTRVSTDPARDDEGVSPGRRGTRRPVSPSTTISGMPPTAVATTGVPHAIASRLMSPKGS